MNHSLCFQCESAITKEENSQTQTPAEENCCGGNRCGRRFGYTDVNEPNVSVNCITRNYLFVLDTADLDKFFCGRQKRALLLLNNALFH